MKALLLDQATGQKDLYLGVLPPPVPQAGELLVQVHAVGLNPVDYKLAAMGWPTWTYPHVLGLDVAGVVSGIGESVTGFQVGDRVFYHGNLRKQGGFAEFATTLAHVVSRFPDGMSFETAAALPCAGYTAWHALHERLHVQQEQTVLVQGAAGGVGGFAVQLAHLAGCRVMASCSAGNIDFVKGLGADEIIDYRSQSIESEIQRLTNGRGVDAIVDTVSPESAAAGLSMLAYAGGMAAVAGRPEINPLEPFTVSPSIHEISLGARYAYGDKAAQARLAMMGNELAHLVMAGKLNPLLTETIILEQIPEALSRLAARHVRGKIVAKIVAG